MPAATTHYRICNLCEAMCGLRLTLAGEEIRDLRGDPDDPFSRGHICPKAAALVDVHHDPDRLRQPLRRTPGGWVTLDWDEALDEVAQRLRQIQAQHGRNAVGVYTGNPTVHNLGAILYNAPFIRALRTRQRFSATSVDQLPHHLAALLLFGHQLLVPVPDIDRTHYLLILGANPVASNGSLMTAPGVERRLKAIQQRGGQVVVVDPRRTETAQIANRSHFIRPGADVLLLLALVNTLYAEGWVNLGRLAALVDGAEALAALAHPYTPERVAPHTGLTPADIYTLARELSQAESAVVYGRIGTSTQRFGGLCNWLINALNILTGNLDRPGGAMFPLPAVDVVALTALTGNTGHYDRYRSRVSGRPEFGGEFPAATLAEEILTPGPGQIKALVTHAGNPVLSTPNGRQLDEALASLAFMVSIDIYLNETTRHAHIILPPASSLESDQYEVVFHNFAVRNTAKYTPALWPPTPGARQDWQILRALRDRLEADQPATVPPRYDLFRRFEPAQLVDLGLRFGPYGAWGGRRLGPEGLTRRRLLRQPHGVDLGPLTPCLPQRLFTPGKRIDLAPAVLAADLPRVETTFFTAPAASADLDLRLIGRRDLRSNNSWMHNSRRLVKGKARCTLLIHPDDAAARGVAQGQAVVIQSAVGRIVAQAEVTEAIMPGVVCLPHGWGHDRPGVQLAVAQERPGVSLNDLTDDSQLDILSGNAVLNGVPVAVAPAGL